MRGTRPILVIDNDAIKGNRSALAWLSTEAKAEWRRVLASRFCDMRRTPAGEGNVRHAILRTAIGRLSVLLIGVAVIVGGGWAWQTAPWYLVPQQYFVTI